MPLTPIRFHLFSIRWGRLEPTHLVSVRLESAFQHRTHSIRLRSATIPQTVGSVLLSRTSRNRVRRLRGLSSPLVSVTVRLRPVCEHPRYTPTITSLPVGSKETWASLPTPGTSSRP